MASSWRPVLLTVVFPLDWIWYPCTAQDQEWRRSHIQHYQVLAEPSGSVKQKHVLLSICWNEFSVIVSKLIHRIHSFHSFHAPVTLKKYKKCARPPLIFKIFAFFHETASVLLVFLCQGTFFNFFFQPRFIICRNVHLYHTTLTKS